MTSPIQRAEQLRDEYGAADANAAELLCDRHPADAVAFTFVQPDLSSVDVTFGELREKSERVAAGLAELGVVEGDRVATLMGKSQELVIALLAIWRLGAVHVPLFTAFAPGAIAMRVTGNDTKFVITDGAQRAKLAPGEDLPAEREWRVITTGVPEGDDVAFGELLENAGPAPKSVTIGGDGVLVELFTSGTTGTPKAVPMRLGGMAGVVMYLEYGIDYADDDVFWNIADPGWAYGLYIAILAPMAKGRRSLLVCAAFDPVLTWRVLAHFGVTNFAAAPTVYRALRNAPVPEGVSLRRLSSAGEPLTPDVITWSERTLGVAIRDHYGQTETGMTVVNAWHPDLLADIKIGSMGHPMPGYTVEILDLDSEVPAAPGAAGRVAIATSSPLLTFRGYRNAPEASAKRFTADGQWYLTGDVASRDEDGYFTFASRDDDVILMAGYRIGPFEVESVLTGHDSIAEAAVIGVPDELRGEVLIAIAVPTPGVEPDDALVAELQQLVKQKLAAHVYPRRVHFVPELPKTPSGKVQRFLLRERFRD
ncbi:AMP-binding protein [Nocardia sp. CDC153]|uniref:AMP-binding protein n=1 Tax=Nocardia sp. CDC153 TaxID=3112167 RepID=UPI002DBB5B63|nr:AMP-binding protein [Nocardia sp. CDC153]MEC3951736.1 AMP-binding protein [Nocardia sp. CDC153]